MSFVVADESKSVLFSRLSRRLFYFFFSRSLSFVFRLRDNSLLRSVYYLLSCTRRLTKSFCPNHIYIYSYILYCKYVIYSTPVYVFLSRRHTVVARNISPLGGSIMLNKHRIRKIIYKATFKKRPYCNMMTSLSKINVILGPWHGVKCIIERLQLS